MAIATGTALAIGAVGSLAGGAMAASAANKAAKAQAAAAQQGIAAEQEGLQAQLALQRESMAQEKQMFEQSLALGQPYRSAGERALTQYEQMLYGTPGQDYQGLEAERMGALAQTPGYQFQMEEGVKALERGASARSGLLGGAQSKALTRFGQGLASTSYNSFMDRLAGVSGQGASVSGAGANAAMQSGMNQAGILSGMASATGQSAGNVGSLLSQQGAARASGYLGQASGINQGLNYAVGMYGMFGGFGKPVWGN